MRRFILFATAFIMGLYCLYVGAIPLFLNTVLFAKATGMEDPASTHLRITRAWSLIPGRVRAKGIRVAVREPTVDLDVELTGVDLHIDLRRLFERRVRITQLGVAETTVAMRTKPPADNEEQVPPEAKAAELTPVAREEEERDRLAHRWKIEVERVDLPKIPAIAVNAGRLQGDIAITGAFMLQPGTQAEIFPTRLTIKDGAWNDEIRAIQVTSDVRFDHFFKARTSGSEVLKKLHAHVIGSATATSLRFLNLSLRSLGEYGFGQGVANVAAEVRIVKGRIQPRSRVRTDRSVIRMNGPRFEVSGQGEMEWFADDVADASHLRVEIRDAKTKVRFGGNRIAGSVRRVNADAKVLGLDLTSAFSGLTGRLRVRGGELDCQPVGSTPPDGIVYRGKARIDGELSAIAGTYSDREGIPPPSSFTVALDRTFLKVPSLGALTGAGKVTLAVRPIDFRFGRAELPRLKFEYAGLIDERYPVDLIWTSHSAARIFGSARPSDDRWRGKGELAFRKFDGVLNFLSDSDRISGLLRTGLAATDVKAAIEWEIAEDDTRLRLKNLDSNGIWSGFGTLVSEHDEKKTNANTRGEFEGKVLGVPIGIGLVGRDVRVKLLPSREWFENLRRP